LGSVTFLGFGRKAGAYGCKSEGAMGWRCLRDTDCVGRSRFVVTSEATIMAKKKKDRLRVHKEARRLARLGVGMPPTERTIPDKRQKAPRHKKKLVAPDLS
jgi:hypothetical protein